MVDQAKDKFFGELALHDIQGWVEKTIASHGRIYQ